jgi:hypothetical protein
MSSVLDTFIVDYCFDGVVGDTMCHTNPDMKSSERSWARFEVAKFDAFDLKTIVVENRRRNACCSERIVGGDIAVYRNSELLWESTFVTESDTYTFAKPAEVSPEPSAAPTIDGVTCFQMSTSFL